MRQLGVGSQGGAEALAIFHQLLSDEWTLGTLVTVEYKFIQNHFHPKRVNFIQNHFHPNTTFIPNQFHPKPLSSQNNFIQNQFHPKNDFDERTTANKSKNNIVRVCVKASAAEGRRRLHTNTAYTRLSGFNRPSCGASPAEGRRCSTWRSVEGRKAV